MLRRNAKWLCLLTVLGLIAIAAACGKKDDPAASGSIIPAFNTKCGSSACLQ